MWRIMSSQSGNVKKGQMPSSSLCDLASACQRLASQPAGNDIGDKTLTAAD
jgi:hypothetical protein